MKTDCKLLTTVVGKSIASAFWSRNILGRVVFKTGCHRSCAPHRQCRSLHHMYRDRLSFTWWSQFCHCRCHLLSQLVLQSYARTSSAII
jgi:hypothetical protein